MFLEYRTPISMHVCKHQNGLEVTYLMGLYFMGRQLAKALMTSIASTSSAMISVKSNHNLLHMICTEDSNHISNRIVFLK